MIHTPVMAREVVHYLLHPASKVVCDATTGCGGHSRAILEANSSVRLIGIDRDPEALREAEKTLGSFGDRVQLIRGNFGDIGRLLSSQKTDGILADLGISSLQLDRTGRGFSYSEEGPLDMRMSGAGGTDARDLLEQTGPRDLADILRNYGEVSRPMRIARSISAAAAVGELKTTGDLRNAVAAALHGDPSPALLSRVFQAIRIAVNDEMTALERFLDQAVDCLNPSGTLVILSYHSLEDRRVKQFFVRESRDCICPPRTPVCVCSHKASLATVTKRALRPGADEVKANPRARSARLRVARRLAQERS